MAADRVTHFALGANDATEYGSMVLYGFTNQPISSLVPMAKMWRHPPAVTNVTGAKSDGYEKDQRAFVFSCIDKTISFTIDASEDSPVVNPFLVLDDWNFDDVADVSINGQRVISSKKFRQGTTYDTRGVRTKVVWLEFKSSHPVEFRILRQRSLAN